MDLNKLSTGDKVIAGSGILFLISMFLPWWGLDLGEFGSASNSGFDYFLTGWLPLLIVIAMVAVIYITRFTTTELPKLPLPWSQVFLIAGGVVAVLLVLRVIIGSSEGSGGFEVDLDRMWGLWVALLAAIGVGAGGFLKSKEPELEQVGGGYAGGGYPPPPPGGNPPPPPPGWLVVLTPTGRADFGEHKQSRGPAAAGPRRVRASARPDRRATTAPSRPYCVPMAVNGGGILGNDRRGRGGEPSPACGWRSPPWGAPWPWSACSSSRATRRRATAATTARTCPASCCRLLVVLAGYALMHLLRDAPGGQRRRHRRDPGPAGPGAVPHDRRRRRAPVLDRGVPRPARARVGPLVPGRPGKGRPVLLGFALVFAWLFVLQVVEDPFGSGSLGDTFEPSIIEDDPFADDFGGGEFDEDLGGDEFDEDFGR